MTVIFLTTLVGTLGTLRPDALPLVLTKLAHLHVYAPRAALRSGSREKKRRL